MQSTACKLNEYPCYLSRRLYRQSEGVLSMYCARAEEKMGVGVRVTRMTGLQ